MARPGDTRGIFSHGGLVPTDAPSASLFRWIMTAAWRALKHIRSVFGTALAGMFACLVFVPGLAGAALAESDGVWVLQKTYNKRTEISDPGRGHSSGPYEKLVVFDDNRIAITQTYSGFDVKDDKAPFTTQIELKWSSPPKEVKPGDTIALHVSIALEQDPIPFLNPRFLRFFSQPQWGHGAFVVIDRSNALSSDDVNLVKDIRADKTLSIQTPNRYIGLSIKTMEVVGFFKGYFLEESIHYVYAFEERAPATAQPASTGQDVSGAEHSVPWKVVGAGVAAVVTAAVVIRAIRRRLRNHDDQTNDDDVSGYILQLDPDILQIDQSAPQSLDIAVWKVMAKGGQSIAADTAIEIVAPASASGLSVAPLAGSGRLCAMVALVGPPPADDVVLQVVATTAKGSKTGAVRITFAAQDMVVDVDGERDVIQVQQHAEYAAVVRYDETERRWRFGDLVVHFTRAGSNQAVSPGFAPVFDQPVADPVLPGLQFDGPTTSDGPTWRWRVSLAPDAQLDEDWLLDDGALKVTVSCQPGQASA